MPAVSKKQQRYFGYLLSNPEERKKKGISKKAAKDFARDVAEQEVHWHRGGDSGKMTPRRKALNRADEFDNRGQNDRAAKIRSIVISKDHGDDYDARRKAKRIKVDDKKVGKLPRASIDDKRGAISGDVQKKLKPKKLSEVSPPGWGHTKAEKEKTKPWKPKSKIGGTAAAFKRALDDGRFKGLPGSTTKKEKTADMFKLMWSMKKKGDKPHYKPGTDKKYKKYQEESLSVKDSKKLKKASVLDQSKDPKDWDSARARRTEIDYKDLMRQIKAKKKMRKESVENGKVDLTLKAGVNNVLKQDNKEYDRGLLAQVNKDGSYDVAYWYDKYKAYPVEVEIDGKTCAKDAKKIHIKFHPELKKEEASYKQRDKALKKSKKAMDFRHRTIHKGGDDDVNEATTMRDNNLFGNAYAGSYETLKKKIGSKKKHNKPAFKEGISYKDFMRNVYID